MNFSLPKKDLVIARSEIEKMKSTISFSEFTEAWQNYLMRIEKVWEFVERALRGQPGFQQWYAPYNNLRRKDPLLIFLRQARNAEVHSATATVAKPLKMAVVDRSGRGFQLNSISSRLENGTLTIDLDSPDILLNLNARLIPTDPEVVRFKCRGKWYNPPWQHLKERISNLHPVYIASVGLDFYNVFLQESEFKFGNN